MTSIPTVKSLVRILKWYCRRFRGNHKQTSAGQWWKYQVRNQYLFSLNLQDLCCLHEIVVFLLSARDKKEPIISIDYSLPGKCIRQDPFMTAGRRVPIINYFPKVILYVLGQRD
jgi:hypothetical protein